jgi:hypothetical protein
MVISSHLELIISLQWQTLDRFSVLFLNPHSVFPQEPLEALDGWESVKLGLPHQHFNLAMASAADPDCFIQPVLPCVTEIMMHLNGKG